MLESLCSQIRGPLAPFAPGLVGYLRGQGYTDEGIDPHLRLLAELSQWLEVEGLGSQRPGAKGVEAFVASRRAGDGPVSIPV